MSKGELPRLPALFAACAIPAPRLAEKSMRMAFSSKIMLFLAVVVVVAAAAVAVPADGWGDSSSWRALLVLEAPWRPAKPES
jgi:hypothetical protein